MHDPPPSCCQNVLLATTVLYKFSVSVSTCCNQNSRFTLPCPKTITMLQDAINMLPRYPQRIVMPRSSGFPPNIVLPLQRVHAENLRKFQNYRNWFTSRIWRIKICLDTGSVFRITELNINQNLTRMIYYHLIKKVVIICHWRPDAICCISVAMVTTAVLMGLQGIE